MPLLKEVLDFTHYSNSHYIQPYDMRQYSGPKPRGLWISVDNEYSWDEWTKENNFPIGKNTFKVILRNNSDIIHLSSEYDMILFNNWVNTESCFSLCPMLDWEGISRFYAGIVISPYLWNCRLDRDFGWYYGWDCASGCIWNKDAIDDIVYLTDNIDASQSYTYNTIGCF